MMREHADGEKNDRELFEIMDSCVFRVMSDEKHYGVAADFLDEKGFNLEANVLREYANQKMRWLSPFQVVLVFRSVMTGTTQLQIDISSYSVHIQAKHPACWYTPLQSL